MARAAGGAGGVDAGLRKEEEEMIPKTAAGRDGKGKGVGAQDGWMEGYQDGRREMGWGATRMGNEEKRRGEYQHV